MDIREGGLIFSRLLGKLQTGRGKDSWGPERACVAPLKPGQGEQGLSLVHFPPWPTLFTLGCFWLFMEEGVSGDKMTRVGWVKTQGNQKILINPRVFAFCSYFIAMAELLWYVKMKTAFLVTVFLPCFSNFGLPAQFKLYAFLWWLVY